MAVLAQHHQCPKSHRHHPQCTSIHFVPARKTWLHTTLRHVLPLASSYRQSISPHHHLQEQAPVGDQTTKIKLILLRHTRRWTLLQIPHPSASSTWPVYLQFHNPASSLTHRLKTRIKPLKYSLVPKQSPRPSGIGEMRRKIPYLE